MLEAHRDTLLQRVFSASLQKRQNMKLVVQAFKKAGYTEELLADIQRARIDAAPAASLNNN